MNQKKLEGILIHFKIYYIEFTFNVFILIERRNNFQSNLNKINLHNQKYNNGTVSYSQGITPFSDMVTNY